MIDVKLSVEAAKWLLRRVLITRTTTRSHAVGQYALVVEVALIDALQNARIYEGLPAATDAEAAASIGAEK